MFGVLAQTEIAREEVIAAGLIDIMKVNYYFISVYMYYTIMMSAVHSEGEKKVKYVISAEDPSVLAWMMSARP